MADTTNHTAATFPASLGGVAYGVTRAAAYVFETFSRMTEINSTAHQRLEQAERLQAKSDAELAKLGIERHEIPRYVFRDLFWS